MNKIKTIICVFLCLTVFSAGTALAEENRYLDGIHPSDIELIKKYKKTSDISFGLTCLGSGIIIRAVDIEYGIDRNMWLIPSICGISLIINSLYILDNDEELENYLKNRKSNYGTKIGLPVAIAGVVLLYHQNNASDGFLDLKIDNPEAKSVFSTGCVLLVVSGLLSTFNELDSPFRNSLGGEPYSYKSRNPVRLSLEVDVNYTGLALSKRF